MIDTELPGRAFIFPERDLPRGEDVIARGRDRARFSTVGDSRFLKDYGVGSEVEYKRRAMEDGRVMLHAQIGYRDLEKSRRAWNEIANQTAKHGGRIDRYGICLDWSMGYPAAERHHRPRGTGLILQTPEDFAKLTAEAPVAAHFGDFVIGTPAALENTEAALHAGATTIGNLGQYFTFRMPGWDEDVETTRASLMALALCAAQPVPILIHSNLDDGFAALFTDLACAFGAVLLERYIVEELVGGIIGHCFGHTFSEPLTRVAFQQALASGREVPGTMVYGNTTLFRADVHEASNYAALGSYLGLDAAAQLRIPSGHAVHAVPVSEAERIPDIDEVSAAQIFALRTIERAQGLSGVMDDGALGALSAQILAGGEAFCAAVLGGLRDSGIDTRDAFEMLLALRRIGAKRLEELYGPGPHDAAAPRGRRPVVEAPALKEINLQAEEIVSGVDRGLATRLSESGLRILLAGSDVHEYGKLLVEAVLRRLELGVLDGGIHAEPEMLAALASREGCDAIAISTYNGIALDYLESLKAALAREGCGDLPVFAGGRLNQIPRDSNTSLPVDVTPELRARGAIPCARVEEMLIVLAADLGEGRET